MAEIVLVDEGIGPDVFEQFFLGDDLSGVPDEVKEDVEGAAAEGDGSLIAEQCAALGVDTKFAELEYLFLIHRHVVHSDEFRISQNLSLAFWSG